ncbi:type VI secretion protein [Agrobacterium vitis]|uniref:virB8 family protein n=1 Tax=Allorhizobium ampelinum TaxID=3025782 RepID=UPI001F31F889|nr:type IV secretion system protein [Allorhizobium ampelinum]MCF1450524.1 type VI secretion protein [Allorhizobium ampelinum]
MKEKFTAYFDQGTVWEEQNRRLRTAILFGSLACGLAGLVVSIVAVLAVMGLAPLKTFEPYIVLVDKTTGYIEIKSERNASAETLSMTDRQAVSQANVVRFVRMREGYDPYQIQDNFGVAALLSTDKAARDLQDLYSATNPRNPTKVLGRNKRVLVDVKSVTFGNDSTALVRFSTEEKSDTDTVLRHYVGVVRFRYTSQPQTNSWRFENPLGFQVYDYRRDDETPGKE